MPQERTRRSSGPMREIAASLRECPSEVFWRDQDGERTPDFNRIFGWHLRTLYGTGPDAAVPIRDLEDMRRVWNLSSVQRAISKEASIRRRSS